MLTQPNPFAKELEIYTAFPNKYSEEKGQIVSMVQNETCWWILDKDLDTNISALQRCQEYAHEAESCRV